MLRDGCRDLAIGVSLANLLFIGVWDELLTVGPNSYLRDVSAASVVAVMLDVLLLGTAFAGAVILARRFPPPPQSPYPLHAAKAAFLVAALLPVMRIYDEFHFTKLAQFVSRAVETPDHTIRLSELNPLVPLVVFAIWPAQSVRIVRALVLFLFPLTLVTFGRGAWRLATGDITAANADRALAVPLSALPSTILHPPPRIVVFLFDELDFRLAYSERPAGVELPELDRLRAEAFFASQAFRPGRRTELSLPALLTGRPVTGDARRGPATLLLTFAGSAPPDTVSWADQPNLFDRARALGYNSGVVGWYHPYCRVLAQDLTRCFWLPHADAIVRARQQTLPRQAVALVASLSPLADRHRHIADYRRLLDEARAAVVDTTLGFVLVHLPVPHNPVIFDRRDDALTAHNYSVYGYYDNLVLTDHALGTLRSELEAAGLWNRTTVVLTSDHSRRAGERDPRVPFVVKLAGRNTGDTLTYRKPFNSIALHDLVLALLGGELAQSSPATLAAWLDRWRARSPAADFRQ